MQAKNRTHNRSGTGNEKLSECNFFTSCQFKDRMENHNKATVILSIKLINKTSVTETFEHIAPMPESYPRDSNFKGTPK